MSYDTPENVLKAWRESAAYWEMRRADVESIFHPLTEALIAAAAIGGGHTILDVAGGIGEPALEIAEVAGPSGSVVHTDPVAEMLAAARREASRRRLSNLTSQPAFAQDLPFISGAFDATVCRLGVMFFPNPTAALSEMLRVTKPGGRVSLAVWTEKHRNPFFSIVTDVMSEYVETAPEPPDAPGAFRFADSGKLASVLRDAGALAVREERLSFRMRANLPLDQYWPLRLDLSDTLRGKAKTLSEAQRIEVSSRVQSAAREFFESWMMDFPATALIVSGRNRRG